MPSLIYSRKANEYKQKLQDGYNSSSRRNNRDDQGVITPPSSRASVDCSKMYNHLEESEKKAQQGLLAIANEDNCLNNGKRKLAYESKDNSHREANSSLSKKNRGTEAELQGVRTTTGAETATRENLGSDREDGASEGETTVSECARNSESKGNPIKREDGVPQGGGRHTSPPRPSPAASPASLPRTASSDTGSRSAATSSLGYHRAPPPMLTPSPASYVADLVGCLLRPQQAGKASGSGDKEEDPKSSLVALMALRKLQGHVDSCGTFAVCGRELAYCGVYAAVVEAMRRHPSDGEVQLEAVTLLWTCTVNDHVCRCVLRQLGVVPLVAKALSEHLEDTVLHQMGYGLLSELILLPKEHHDELGDAEELLKVVPVALSALHARMKEDARYAKRITVFLLRMLRVERKRTRVVILEADGLKVTFDAIHEGSDEESQQRARDLMKALL